MAAFEVIALDTATPQLRAPGAADTYTFPRAVEMPLGTANGVLYLNGSKVVTSGSGLTFASNLLAAPNMQVSGVGNYLYFDTTSGAAANYIRTVNDFDMRLYCGRGSTSYTDITTDGIRWGIAASEQMRLNSTGLGIGTSSPGVKLDVQGSTPFARVKENSTGYLGFRAENNSGNFYFGIDSSTGGFYGSAYARVLYSDGAYPMVFYTNATERMRLDSSGNLGLGVAPSNAYTPGKVLQIVDGGVILYGSSTTASLGNNFNIDASGNALYQLSQGASGYQQSAGTHRWLISTGVPSAGNPVSFTQAMTLDASGNLGIGTTSPAATAGVTLSKTSNVAFEALLPTVASVAFGYNNSGSANAWGAATGSAFFGTPQAVPIAFTTGAVERARIPAAGGMVVGTAALATTATDGFLYVPTCAGQPTGTPTTQTGTAPIVVDTTNNKLYFYSGGAWRDAGP